MLHETPFKMGSYMHPCISIEQIIYFMCSPEVFHPLFA